MKKFLKIILIIILAFSFNIKNINAEELPKIYLEGNIENMTSKNDKRKINLYYVSNELEFDAYTIIKIQGNSSLGYDKKNYNIKLYENTEYTDKKNIDIGQNWGEQNEYYLKANWIDKTHSRNIVTSNIVATIQNKYNLFMNTPNNSQIDGFPVEVYINNEFLGLYTWNIPKDNWMLNMDNDNPDHIAIIANTYTKTTAFKETTTLEKQDWEIEVGPETQETIDKFNRLITFIKNSSDNEFKNNFQEYLNLDATLNYYIMINLANLNDNITKNIFLVTYDGKIWYPTLYDLDTSWGTNWKGTSTTDYTKSFQETFNDNLLWSKFQKNFQKEIADQYFELRKEILTKNNILKNFNNFYNTIPAETLTKEQTKWQNIPGYGISQIEEFLDTRIPIIDKEIYNLYNITPQINIEYSTQEATLKPVTVTITPNRNDIIITKDGKKSYDYTYIFKENGDYTFEYQDWYGNNLGSITITINCIKTKEIISIIIAILIIIIGTTLYIATKNKSTKKNNKTNSNSTNTNKVTNKTNKKSTNKKKSTNSPTKENNSSPKSTKKSTK